MKLKSQNFYTIWRDINLKFAFINYDKFKWFSRKSRRNICHEDDSAEKWDVKIVTIRHKNGLIQNNSIQFDTKPKDSSI